MQTLHHRDGVYQVSGAQPAHDVGVELAQVHPRLLLGLGLPGGLGHGESGGLLDRSHHLHPILVLERRGPGGAGRLVHGDHFTSLKNKKSL